MTERERKMREIRNARLVRRGYLSWTDECTGSNLTRESFCDVVYDLDDMLTLPLQSSCNLY